MNIPSDFDWEKYKELNVDLSNLNQYQTIQHYLQYGIKENTKNFEDMENVKDVQIINKDYLISNCENVLFNYSKNSSITIKNICTMSTESNLIELKLFLLSLNLFYCGDVYIICDDFIDNWIKISKVEYPNINIFTINHLNKYRDITSNSQQTEITKKIWIEFMLEKTTIIKYVLSNSPNGVLFLDSDIVLLDKLPMIPDKDIVLSIHNIGSDSHNKFGFFNGGCVYVKNINFAQWWRDKTIELGEKVYMEQGTLNHIDNNFDFGVFTDQFNFGFWRYGLGNDVTDISLRKHNITHNNNNILYKNHPILSIHTHFFTKCSFSHELNMVLPFNKLIIDLIKKTNNNKLHIIKDYITTNQQNILDDKLLNLYYSNKITNKQIIFICDNGLTNRIMSLINAILFSKINNTLVHIYWPLNNTCDCSYFDIFKMSPNINVLTEYEFTNYIKNNKVIHISTRELKELNLNFENINNYNIKIIDEKYENENILKYMQDENAVYLFSYYYLASWALNNEKDIYKVYDELEFTDNIKYKIDNFVKTNNINHDVYGIHIRLTDSTFVINNLDLITKIKNDITSILLNNKNQRFYLASDDGEIKDIFLKEFKQNIIINKCTEFNKITNNSNCLWGNKYECNNIYRSKQSVIDGFIEFNILNNTLFKYPTGSSTYSILIAIMQGHKYNSCKYQKWFSDCSKIEKHIDYKLI